MALLDQSFRLNKLASVDRFVKRKDEMQRAMETGEAYRTRLEPPPADVAVAHEGRMGVDIHIY